MGGVGSNELVVLFSGSSSSVWGASEEVPVGWWEVEDVALLVWRGELVFDGRTVKLSKEGFTGTVTTL